MRSSLVKSSLVALAALGAIALPALAFAQNAPAGSGMMNPTYPVTPDSQQSSASNNSNPTMPVYDMAPAMARAALAAAEYDRTYIDLTITVSRTRQSFSASSELVTATHELEDAQSGYDSASQAAMTTLWRDPAYQAAIQKRTELEVDLRQAASPALRADVAERKMQAGAAVSRIEADALASDANVKAAKARLVTAQQAVADKTAKFESGLYDNAQIASARQVFEAARVNRAGAEGYLSGALMTRSDIIGADERRYPNTGNYAAGGGYWDPYTSGYFGIGEILVSGGEHRHFGF